MASRDGNGWVYCARGHRHWGKYGAAGLLAYAGQPGQRGAEQVLLQHRAGWSHHGGTWGLPGGAADSHEAPVAAALREAAEETGVAPEAVVVRGIYTDDHGGWAYRTVLASAQAPFPAFAASDETDAVAWVAASQAAGRPLHPGLALHWAELRAALEPLVVIVDAANVVGSRPDGWWRDRAGAARRLVTGLGTLAGQGVTDIPAGLGLPEPARWFPEFVVVLEGQARAAAGAAAGPGDTALDRTTARTAVADPDDIADPGDTAEPPGASGGSGGSGVTGAYGEPGASGMSERPGRPDVPGASGIVDGPVRVVSADGSGDDTIARLAAAEPGRLLVVTADRELRARCEAAGAQVTGPRWLTERLDAAPR
ncbi:MAG TPA: NUDIX hydrolase [Streptosporangiaceae bacterium]|nr:NUDIX hydrolase [Streptosporangiaceae bacterium]